MSVRPNRTLPSTQPSFPFLPFALLPQSESHALSFQPLPFTLSLEGHSLCVYSGYNQERPADCRPRGNYSIRDGPSVRTALSLAMTTRYRWFRAGSMACALAETPPMFAAPRGALAGRFTVTLFKLCR